MDSNIIAAIISVFGVIVAALIAGYCTLHKDDKEKDKTEIHIHNEVKPQPEKKDEKKMNIPKETNTADGFNSDDYVHNEFIPSLDELKKTDSNKEFFKKSALFIHATRPSSDTTHSKKR